MSVSVERELDDPAIVNLKPLPVPPLNLNLNLTPTSQSSGPTEGEGFRIGRIEET